MIKETIGRINNIMRPIVFFVLKNRQIQKDFIYNLSFCCNYDKAFGNFLLLSVRLLSTE